MTPFSRNAKDPKAVVPALGLAAAFGALLFFCLRVKTGLNLFEWGDETEKLVAAQMLNKGLHLYKDVFAHHGPLPYLIAHLYARLVSDSDFSLLRLSVAFLAFASGLSVYFSPIFKGIAPRAWATAIYFSLLSSVWLVHGIHMLLYQQIGGFFFVIALAQVAIPALLAEDVRKWGSFWCGLSLTLACFTAYAFGPAAVLLLIASVVSLKAANRQIGGLAGAFLAGVALATAIVTIWLLNFGDLLGYLIYHLYFNQKIYTNFVAFSFQEILGNLSVSPSSKHFVKAMSLAYFAAWFVATLILFSTRTGNRAKRSTRLLALLIVICSVLLMNPRGDSDFHNAGIVVVNIAGLSLLAGALLQRQATGTFLRDSTPLLIILLMIAGGTELIARHALSTPNGYARENFASHRAEHKPASGGMYEFVRMVTKKDDRILSLVFKPIFYIKSGRLPASGQFYYLPWQAAYEHSPILGYSIDFCQSLVTHSPTVIWFDNWKVWDKYLMQEYAPCFSEQLRSRYKPRGDDGRLYVRNDLAHDIGLDEPVAGTLLRDGVQLTKYSPIRLNFLPETGASRGPIRRIGIMFRVSTGRSRQDAELRLKSSDGAEIYTRFAVDDLVDRKYRFFEIEPREYYSGEIFSVGGGGVSTLETVNEYAASSTCMIYEYGDGRIRMTPGCPLF